MAGVVSYYPLDELIDRFDISNTFDKDSVKQLSLFLKNNIDLKKVLIRVINFL